MAGLAVDHQDQIIAEGRVLMSAVAGGEERDVGRSKEALVGTVDTAVGGGNRPPDALAAGPAWCSPAAGSRIRSGD